MHPAYVSGSVEIESDNLQTHVAVSNLPARYAAMKALESLYALMSTWPWAMAAMSNTIATPLPAALALLGALAAAALALLLPPTVLFGAVEADAPIPPPESCAEASASTKPGIARACACVVET